MTTDQTPFGRFVRKVTGDPRATPPAGTTTPPTHVTGGYGVVPGAKHAINTSVPTPVQKITQRDAQNLMNAEILAALRELVTSTTELTSQIGRQGAINGVLRVGSYVFAPDGVMEFNHPVTVGSVIVHNLGASDVTVQIGPGAAASTPGLGQNFHVVPAGDTVKMPVGSKGFVLYGTAAEGVNVQAFTGLQAYGAAL